jgi:DNA invertase Pin-like site-specific DNA recombinase
MNRTVYAYARVSSRDQNLQRQIEQLREYVTDERYILTEKQSGKDFERRVYNSLVGTPETAPRLQQGDLLVILSLDRLGRNYEEIREQWQHITRTLRADIKVIDMPLLDTSSVSDDLDNRFIAELVLQILSYLAQKERENTLKRQRQGINCMPIVDGKRVSLKTGNPVGRPEAEYPPEWGSVFSQWQSRNITSKYAMELLGIKRSTFYKLVARYKREAV